MQAGEMAARRTAERIAGKQGCARMGCTDFDRRFIMRGGAGMVARIEIGSPDFSFKTVGSIVPLERFDAAIGYRSTVLD
jgi:hypothetical protein